MKKLIIKIKENLIKLFRCLWYELRSPPNIILYLIVLAVFFSPCIIAFFIRTPAVIAAATGYALFWAGPFTPAVPIQLAITFGIRKLLMKTKRGKRIFCKHKEIEFIRNAQNKETEGKYKSWWQCCECGKLVGQKELNVDEQGKPYGLANPIPEHAKIKRR